ncbi:glycosyltransferase family 9 protein, partial [bacterium AH-315-J21]|nr:glycosyltransferase family 9 protein [bacterium AH-315-J21]
PVYRAIKQTAPNCHLAVLCREYTEPILRDNPNINEIITISQEDSAELEATIQHLKEGAYDIAIALFPSPFCATALKAAKIPIRIGSARRFHSWKFTHRINQSRKRNEKSEAQYNLDLLQPLGILSSDTTPEVSVTETERKMAKKTLEKLGVINDNEASTAIVALHPGSAGSAIDWPLDNFVDLAEGLLGQGIIPIFTGNQIEEKLIDNALTNRSSSLKSLAGQTTLKELTAILALTDVVVANSTGPLHLAAAIGVDTVGLFPRSAAMSPTRWAPPVENTTILHPQNHDSNSESLNIPVNDVSSAILASLSSKGKT